MNDDAAQSPPAASAAVWSPAGTLPSHRDGPTAWGGPGGRAWRWFALVIVAAAVVGYLNSFRGVFVLDDYPSIVTNATIQHVSWATLNPPTGQGLTVEARPVLNLSLALDYALSGTDGWSYHATNLAIHIGAGLLLFGLLRWLLRRSRLHASDELAFVITLLWVLHPLQTESVTYVVQRTESLMGLLYFGTVYCLVRALEQPGGGRNWLFGSFACCALGVGAKEVIVSAPLLALVIDVTFYADSWREPWRQRTWYYAGLFGTWVLLGAVELGHLSRGGTIGTAAGIAWWQYTFCQARALLEYLKLSVWPHPLIFDYGSDFVTFWQIWAFGLVDVLLLAGTAWALVRRSVFGAIGAWFFLILAPTSSFVGGSRQMLADHRMYLPLAAVIVLVAGTVYAALGARRARVAIGLAAVAFGGLTIRRNTDYRSDLALYADNFAKRAGNAYATYNYAYALREHGQNDAAIVQYDATLRLKPDYADAQYDLADLLAKLPGHESEAVPHYEALLRLRPDDAGFHNEYGVLLGRLGRRADAAAQFQAAVRLRPSYPEAEFNLGYVLSGLDGRLDEAVAAYEAAVRDKPDYAEAHNSLALLLVRIPGRQPDALTHLDAAVRARPDYYQAQTNLGILLARTPGRAREAVEHLEAAARLQPKSAEAHFNLAMGLQQLPDRRKDCLAELTEALRLDPNLTEAQQALAALEGQ